MLRGRSSAFSVGQAILPSAAFLGGFFASAEPSHTGNAGRKPAAARIGCPTGICIVVILSAADHWKSGPRSLLSAHSVFEIDPRSRRSQLFAHAVRLLPRVHTRIAAVRLPGPACWRRCEGSRPSSIATRKLVGLRALRAIWRSGKRAATAGADHSLQVGLAPRIRHFAVLQFRSLSSRAAYRLLPHLAAPRRQAGSYSETPSHPRCLIVLPVDRERVHVNHHAHGRVPQARTATGAKPSLSWAW